MVMDYLNNGDMREYMKSSYYSLTTGYKLGSLRKIAFGLKIIHEQGLVHKDFHPGNIITRKTNKDTYFSITDLGLSRPADEADEGKVYGVLPYVAPEVLCGKPYTPPSDVYSFSMIIYEHLVGLPPYHDVPHDESLSVKIYQGLHPNLKKIKMPQLLEDLIKRC